MLKTICYLCKVGDPNEVHYDSNKHHVCLVCAVKLWEIASAGVEFDCRDSTVVIKLENGNKTKKRSSIKNL